MKKTTIAFVTALLLGAAATGLWLVARQEPAGRSASHSQSPFSNPKSLPLHPVVKQIVKDGPATPYLKLNYVIKEIPTDLARHDISALLAFITGPRPPSFAEGEWGSLTNDIQEALSVQASPSPEVARTLIATFRDIKQTQMMRDYALQHIGGFAIYLVHTAHTRGGGLPPFFDDLSGELIAAAKDTAASWSGTAMNLLDGILRAAEYRSMEVPGITPESLASLALPAMKDTSAPLNARLPALQLASRRGAPEAVSYARTVLGDGSSPIMLVQSAAAVLAVHGTKDDLPLLRSAPSNLHTTVALKNAIRSIEGRSKPD